jgi:acyl carrier protein
MGVQDEIRAYIAEALLPGEGPDAVGDDTELIESGILDSLALVKMILHLEQRYGVSLAREEIVPEYFASVAAIAALVERKRRPNE